MFRRFPDYISTRLNRALGRNQAAPARFSRSVEKSRLAESLVRCASRLMEQPRNGRDIIQSVCESLTLATPHVLLAWTWFGPIDTPRIEPQIVAGPAADYARKLSIDRSFFSEAGSAVRTLAGKKGEPFNVSRMSLDGPWREVAALHGIRCSLALPLASTVNDDRGLLVLYADEPDYFEQVGVGLFEALANMFSSVLSVAAEPAQMREAAYSDALTGLLGREAIDVIARPILRTHASDPNATVLLVDVDHFKRTNEEYGRAAGDTLLCSVADRLRRTLRKGDNVLRWGGEEFLVCLPQTDHASATLVAYKMLDAVGQHPHLLQDGRSAALTVSIGVAEVGVDEPLVDVIERADAAVGEAKRQGRNRVCKASAAANSGHAPKVDSRSVLERQAPVDFSRSRPSLL